MEKNKNKNWLTVLILGATVILGGIAVFTAFKLYQIGKEPVAPSAPKPAPAQELPQGQERFDSAASDCTLEFDVETPELCTEDAVISTQDNGDGTTWAKASASIDYTWVALRVENSTSGNYDYFTNPVVSGSYDWTWDSLPIDYNDIISITFIIDYQGGSDTRIECGSWTPTPTPECWDTCNTDADCPDNLACEDVNGTNRCVNPDCSDESDCTCPGITPTPTVTPTPIPECWDTCNTDADCPDNLACEDVNGTNRCVNPDCSDESDCTCPGITPTPTVTPTPTPGETPIPTPTPPPGQTPTPTPEVPVSGFELPTIGAILGGALLIITGLLLAL